jgi:SAM-dependent methyltransferase
MVHSIGNNPSDSTWLDEVCLSAVNGLILFLMSYSKLTFKDKNFVKRWLQNQRLISALKLLNGSRADTNIVCDFGAGDGEFCKLLSAHDQIGKIICYEPMSHSILEAKENLQGLKNIEFCQEIEKLEPESIDVVVCLEVFEHLPPNETNAALNSISALLKPEGKIIVGVPVEVGIPALYKGLFRMSRRYGEFDANIKNVSRSFLFAPPKDRPVTEIAPRINYHLEHMGFDFRHLKEVLTQHFDLSGITTSPFSLFGSWFMPEIYIVGEKAKVLNQPVSNQL